MIVQERNSFYVDGRKLTIDQVDLTTAQTARWRLCPNCSHAQIEETGKNTSACPQCGSPAWADAGQVRTMLKVQMVYSNMDYTKSLISDESDDRNNVFYCKQLLVDVDEDHDISSAYRMDNEDFPFGYEFVRKATLPLPLTAPGRRSFHGRMPQSGLESCWKTGGTLPMWNWWKPPALSVKKSLSPFGISTEMGELNRWIKATNRMLRSMRATIAALKEWIQEAKEILKEPQEIYLAQLLSEAHTMRNQTAMTYARGKTKAKKNNMKRFMDECNYLKQRGVLTLSDFEKYLSSVDEKVEASKSSMNHKQIRLKELQQLMEDAKTYTELKPVFDELKKEKYRFTKAKEKYKAEHESELRRFYMAKRKLKEKGFEKEPFPLSTWQKEFSELSAQREDEYQKYKLMQKELTLLYQIKGDVDKVMRETHPEMLHTDKTKEATL